MNLQLSGKFSKIETENYVEFRQFLHKFDALVILAFHERFFGNF